MFVKISKMYPIVDNQLPEWLKEKLIELGWSNKALADKTHLSEQAISNYLHEIKRRVPNNKALIKIAHAINESPAKLYEVAGLTPPSNIEELDIEEIREIFKNLSREEIEEIKAIGWFKIDYKLKKKNKPPTTYERKKPDK